MTWYEVIFESRPVARRAIGIALLLTCFQQLSGCDLMIAYMPAIMSHAGTVP